MVLVRLEVTNGHGSINRDLWNATATLSIEDNLGVNLDTDQIMLRNGLGSALVTFAGNFNPGGR